MFIFLKQHQSVPLCEALIRMNGKNIPTEPHVLFLRNNLKPITLHITVM